MKKMFVLCLAITLTTTLLSCSGNKGTEINSAETERGTLKTDAITISGSGSRFADNYSLDALDIELEMPQYSLPLNTSNISNFSSFSGAYTPSSAAVELLKKNGFAVIKNFFNAKEESITDPYKNIKQADLPVFITADSLLHLYHIQFDETLRLIEEKEFYDDIWNITKELLLYTSRATSRNPELGKRLIPYLYVALDLLSPSADQICTGYECGDDKFTAEERAKYNIAIPAAYTDIVNNEVALINEHTGFQKSAIFSYNEDFSQYVPRGHYTRSEKLKNYFKTMMWFGRMTYLLKGCDDQSKCLVSEQEAQNQTLTALLIASAMKNNSNIMSKWDRIYSVTSFYVGLSDDMGPYEYIGALNKFFGDNIATTIDQTTMSELKAALLEEKPPQIYSGTGNCQITPPITPEKADECLAQTAGFRLMGQRYVPDSDMFAHLVGTYTGKFEGNELAFTTVQGMRSFPRGLDIMALLGSERAKTLLGDLGDSNYDKYEEAFSKLNNEFGNLTNADWNKNLYWSFLFALKPLLNQYGKGFPTFMKSTAWQDRSLTTALSAWTELRHDTILYAKQSYTNLVTSTPGGGGYETPEKPVVGYVEPVPEFYNRLIALTNMTIKGLDSLGALDDASNTRLQNLSKILARLLNISTTELQNKELTQDDYDFIKNFGDNLNGVIEGVDDKAKKTTLVADVHTDPNTNMCLEEGLGYVNLIVVAYKVPDGRILMGVGPVLTYYEFKQPLMNRLTDEAWRDMIDSALPDSPEWLKDYSEEVGIVQ